MYKWLSQSLLRQWAHLACHSTTHPCWFRCIFHGFPSPRGAPIQNWGAPDMWEVQKGTVYIWKYTCSIMLWRCVNDPQSNYYHQAWILVRRWVFAAHLPIGLILFWPCPVHAPDVDLSTFSFAGKMIEPVESSVLTEMDAMDSIILSTCDGCCTIQLLCHMLSPQHFPLQLSAYEPLSLLDRQYMSDKDSGVISLLRWEYLQVVAYQVYSLWVDC